MIKKTFQINDSSNTRLDIYLSGLLKNESRNKIKSYIKNSSVYVNGESKKPSYLLQNGDKVDISIETEKSIDSNGIIPEKIDFEINFFWNYTITIYTFFCFNGYINLVSILKQIAWFF